VLDYVGRPGAAAIAAANYAGAARYVIKGRVKSADAHELADFDAHGLGMAAVFEDKAGNWRGGRAAGQLDGARGRGYAREIGFPDDRPIYMAIDEDVVTEGQYAIMLDYLRGASGPLGGPELTGVYGEADVIDRARAAGVTAWHWQTVAWSKKRRTPANLYQHAGYVFVGGVQCDVNDVLTTDWGQHNYRKGSNSMQAGELVIDPRTGQSIGPFTDVTFYTNYFTNMIPSLHAKLDAIQGSLDGWEADILVAIRQQAAGVIDVAELAKRLLPPLAAALGDSVAQDILRQLGEALVKEGTTT
jgi:hypothetical protein